jgi:ferredoxin
MIRIKIDNRELEITEGTTLLKAAWQAGIDVPSMCFLDGCGNHPSCMVCLVKDNKTGALVPSCALEAKEGMDISASSEEVKEARRQSLELLMSDHIGDCEAPCSLACPAGMDIPLMNRLIGEFTEALNVVKEEIALPYVLGYICPAPCEKACRRKQVDEAVSICHLKRTTARFGTDERANELVAAADSIVTPSGKKVAIIGTGPAGLAAAYYLQLKGHNCTLFDKAPEAGGTMRYSIPDEELPKSIIDEETGIIKSMGASFILNSLITAEQVMTNIRPAYDAIILATGDFTVYNELNGIAELTKNGFRVNEKNMSTSVEGIFVCGSAIRSHKMAVRSVAQGKTAALSVHNFLQGKKYEKPEKMFNSRFDKLLQPEFDEYLKEATRTGRSDPSGGYLEGFSRVEAVREALRCMHCDCRKKDNCKLRNFSDEYKIDRKRFAVSGRKTLTKQIQHDLVIFEPEKCIKCGLCVDISAAEGEKFGLAFEGRGFDVQITSPIGSTFNEGMIHSAEKCVNACPTGALSFKKDSHFFY